MTIAAVHVDPQQEPVFPVSTVNTPDPLDSVAWLPLTLKLETPVVGFTIGDLLHLTGGSVVASACSRSSDVPLRVNQLLIGWVEFEANDDRLRARITDLA